MTLRRLPFSIVVVLFSVTACKAERVPLSTELGGPSGTGTVMLSSIQAGPSRSQHPIENPFSGNAYAIQQGKRYYEWFNCAGCHGAIGGGSMGPPLSDSDWIYGGQPQHIRDSILRGRPNGMPAFAGRLSEDVVWQLVAYVQSLGGSHDSSAEGSPVSGSDENGSNDEGAPNRGSE